jgi:plastocyanin
VIGPKLLLPALLIAAASSACGKDTSGGAGGSSPASLAAGDRISMRDNRFIPADVRVRVGQKITWVNDETVPHNVVAKSGADFQSDTFGKGKTYTWTPDKAGTVKYVCTLHPGMDGTIQIAAAPSGY